MRISGWSSSLFIKRFWSMVLIMVVVVSTISGTGHELFMIVLRGSVFEVFENVFFWFAC